MKDVKEDKIIETIASENENASNLDIKVEEEKTKFILGMSIKRFVISSIVTTIILLAIIFASTFMLIKLTTSTTLPPQSLFWSPVIISTILSVIYYWIPLLRKIINKICDIGLTASVAIISTVAISKPLGGNYFDSIVMNNNIYSIIVLSYIAVCSITKTIVTIYPNSKRDINPMVN